MGYTENVSRFNYGQIHGSKSKIGSLNVGWNEDPGTIVVVPAIPALSGCGAPVYYRRPKIYKAYRNNAPTGVFIIYPNQKGYIAINTYGWLENASLYIYASQEGALKAFTNFFMNEFETK